MPGQNFDLDLRFYAGLRDRMCIKKRLFSKKADYLTFFVSDEMAAGDDFCQFGRLWDVREGRCGAKPRTFAARILCRDARSARLCIK